MCKITQIMLLFASTLFNVSANDANDSLIHAQKQPNEVQNQQKLMVFFEAPNQRQQQLIDALEFEINKRNPETKIELINIAITPLNGFIQHDYAKTEETTALPCHITIGEKTTQRVLAQRNNKRIYALDVSKNQLDKLEQTYRRLKIAVSGIYQEQSFKRQLLLIKAIEPSNHQVSTLFNQIDRFYLPEYQQIANQLAMSLDFRIMLPSNAPERFLSGLDKSKFLLLLNNRQIFRDGTLSGLVLTATKQNIKLIANREEATAIGALASVYTPLEYLAREASQDISTYCLNDVIDAKPLYPHYAEHFAVNVNQRVAERFALRDLNQSNLEQMIKNFENGVSQIDK